MIVIGIDPHMKSHVSGRLERHLLPHGERLVRVPPKLMAKARASARTPGKSDPIDAECVARAALREPSLPEACLDGPAGDVRLQTTEAQLRALEREIGALLRVLAPEFLALPAARRSAPPSSSARSRAPRASAARLPSPCT